MHYTIQYYCSETDSDEVTMSYMGEDLIFPTKEMATNYIKRMEFAFVCYVVDDNGITVEIV